MTPVASAEPQVSSALAIRLVFAERRLMSEEAAQAWDAVRLDDVIEALDLVRCVYSLTGEKVWGASEVATRGESPPLEIKRLSMESPLELLASIPPAFVAAGGIVGLLATFERVFNLPLSIKTTRDRLLAEGEGFKADRVEAELRRRETEEKLTSLRGRAETAQLVPELAEVVELDDVPVRELDQRMEALRRSNDIRVARATLKRQLRSGEVTLHEVLLDPPEYLATVKVFDLLLAVPRIGRVKANRLLNQCRISPSTTVGGLSERRRAALLSHLRR